MHLRGRAGQVAGQRDIDADLGELPPVRGPRRELAVVADGSGEALDRTTLGAGGVEDRGDAALAHRGLAREERDDLVLGEPRAVVPRARRVGRHDARRSSGEAVALGRVRDADGHGCSGGFGLCSPRLPVGCAAGGLAPALPAAPARTTAVNTAHVEARDHRRHRFPSSIVWDRTRGGRPDERPHLRRSLARADAAPGFSALLPRDSSAADFREIVRAPPHRALRQHDLVAREQRPPVRGARGVLEREVRRIGLV